MHFWSMLWRWLKVRPELPQQPWSGGEVVLQCFSPTALLSVRRDPHEQVVSLTTSIISNKIHVCRCSSIATMGRYCNLYQAGACGGSFQRRSLSRSALHDFNTKGEMQPPGRHGLWFRMLLSSTLHHSLPSYCGSPNILTRFWTAHSHATVKGLWLLGIITRPPPSRAMSLCR